MLARGNAVHCVLDRLLVAIEGEAVDHVALDVLHRHHPHLRRFLLHFARQRPRRIVQVEVLAVEAEQKHQSPQHWNQRRVAHLRNASQADRLDYSEEHKQGRRARDHKPSHWRHKRVVHHVLRRQHNHERHQSAGRRMGPQQPPRQPCAPNAVQIVAGQNRQRWNRRQNVSRQLRLRAGEKHYGKQRPQHKKLRKRIARARQPQIALWIQLHLPFSNRSAHRGHQRPDRNHRPRHQAHQPHRQVIPYRLMVLVQVGRKAFQVVLDEELLHKRRVLPLHSDVPRQHHRQIQKHAGNPYRPPQRRPLPPQPQKQQDDAQRQERRNRPLGQRCRRAEKVQVEQPELQPRLVPCIPPQHSNAQRRSHLHVGRCPARKPDNCHRRRGNQRSIQLSSRPESPHVQEDHRNQKKRAGGRGKPCRPVRDAELPERAHRPPVVERRLFQPRMPVQDRRHRAAVQAMQRVLDVGQPQAARHHTGVQLVAGLGVRLQHLARNLRVARLIGPHQSDLIAAQNRH